MFQNIDEAKDGVDLILDRLAEEAAKLPPADDGPGEAA